LDWEVTPLEIRVEAGDITQLKADAIVVGLFEGIKTPGGATAAVDRAMDGAISRLIEDSEIKGKEGEVTVIHTLGRMPAARVAVVGLGKQEQFSLQKVRDVTATALRHLRRLGCQRVASVVLGAGAGGLEPQQCAQAMAEGAIMGLYRFRRYKADEDEREVQELTLVEMQQERLEALRRGVELGIILAQAANHARDLANEPANILTPVEMAQRAQQLAHDAGLECEVWEEGRIREMGMGALLGVAAGSIQPPRLIIMRYRGRPDSPKAVGLLGKGITFDSGGISLKPAQGMEEMKGDMSGAAAVIACMWALGKLRPPINVTAILPVAENMPSGSAIRPGDILRARNGKTIEVINTDAEGRLILADAICYARELGLSPLIDVATLTGAMAIALGPAATGFFANDDALAQRIMEAVERSGERMWRFPIIQEYRESLRSDVADIKNVGDRYGGAILAAEFLRFFVEETPWAHIDMAPTDNVDRDKGIWVKGATGIPARTLVYLLLQMAQEG
jgi:leucyl aminopeptidase